MLREGNRKAVVTVLEVLLDINAEKIKQVKAPTLILWGERDLWIPVKLSKKFMADLKNPRLITYPGVGHIPMEEIPQKSAEDAKAFLLSSDS
jgi:pimeloyl-ACP methyl ester carboxylesterase